MASLYEADGTASVEPDIMKRKTCTAAHGVPSTLSASAGLLVHVKLKFKKCFAADAFAGPATMGCPVC